MKKIHFPPKAKDTLDRLREENEYFYAAALMVLKQYIDDTYQEENDKKIVAHNISDIIDSGMYKLTFEDRGEFIHTEFLLWSFTDATWKKIDDMEYEDLAILSEMIEYYFNVN